MKQLDQIFEDRAADPFQWLKSREGKELLDTPSPFGRWLKAKVVSVSSGRLSLAFYIREDMCNPSMQVHGGVVSAMVDETIGVSIVSLGMPGFLATISMHVDFINPAPMGATLIAKGKVDRVGNTIVNAECEIYLEDEKTLIARGSSNWLRFGNK